MLRAIKPHVVRWREHYENSTVGGPNSAGSIVSLLSMVRVKSLDSAGK